MTMTNSPKRPASSVDPAPTSTSPRQVRRPALVPGTLCLSTASFNPMRSSAASALVQIERPAPTGASAGVRPYTCASVPARVSAMAVARPPMPPPMMRTCTSLPLFPEQSIQLEHDRVELLLQHDVSIQRVLADLLIHAGRHTGQVLDVRLKTRFAVADRLGLELRGDFFDQTGLCLVRARRAESLLGERDALHRLIRRGHEVAHPHVVIELLLQIRDGQTFGREQRIDQAGQ